MQAALDLDARRPGVVRPKLKPGLGSRPACTTSASVMPSSWNAACRPRLLSSASCTASSALQRRGQQLGHALIDGGQVGVGRGQHELLAQPVLGRLLHRAESRRRG